MHLSSGGNTMKPGRKANLPYVKVLIDGQDFYITRDVKKYVHEYMTNAVKVTITRPKDALKVGYSFIFNIKTR